jgi:hypothetical protein
VAGINLKRRCVCLYYMVVIFALLVYAVMTGIEVILFTFSRENFVFFSPKNDERCFPAHLRRNSYAERPELH